MSSLENVKLEEKAWEDFEKSAIEDGEFRDELANAYLENAEQYLYFKEGADYYLDDQLDEIFETLIKWDWEATICNPIEAARRYLSA